MKKCTVLLVVIMLFCFGEVAFADEFVSADEVTSTEETDFAEEGIDCDCEKGGMGIKIDNFVIGFGARTFNCVKGCNNSVGIGVGIGSETNGARLGFGYNDGVIGLGINFTGSEKTRSFGFGIGYDYGDCRMVWPIEE